MKYADLTGYGPQTDLALNETNLRRVSEDGVDYERVKTREYFIQDQIYAYTGYLQDWAAWEVYSSIYAQGGE